ncbi:MAG TPA: class I SAM-dependent methyltransferase [Candidatus Sulfotelmatobacter sp.]|nr:class I SAM-dependent methyltransferase [Candidatus Sulfotelmatobacter sp.]HUB95773.1 class I SAM-dependent methyltransferase [Stellaceae bacterium]
MTTTLSADAVNPASFGPAYADAYDRLYAAKDYDGECGFVRAAAKNHGCGTELLDLGCGTGRHAVTFADLGYAVTGVDRSEAMLARARERAVASRVATKLRFDQADIADYRAGRTFDVVTMMFAVIDLQIGDAAVRAALDTARHHLEPGGLLIFDCWYGPAVLAQRPSARVKRITHPEGTLLRTGRGDLDAVRQICTVHYDIWWMPKGAAARHTEEHQEVRFFFPVELELLMARAGMVLRRMCDFEHPEQPPSEASWNVWCVAEAV